MGKKTAVFVLLLMGVSLVAQASQESQQPPKSHKGQVTVQGCISRSSGRYILMQSEGNSYVLEATRKINVDHYLGQQVEVTGSETPTLSTSSTMKPGAAPPPVTIMVDSIHVVAKRCTH